jgi:hypothetical protein
MNSARPVVPALVRRAQAEELTKPDAEKRLVPVAFYIFFCAVVSELPGIGLGTLFSYPLVSKCVKDYS